MLAYIIYIYLHYLPCPALIYFTCLSLTFLPGAQIVPMLRLFYLSGSHLPDSHLPYLPNTSITSCSLTNVVLTYQALIPLPNSGRSSYKSVTR